MALATTMPSSSLSSSSFRASHHRSNSNSNPNNNINNAMSSLSISQQGVGGGAGGYSYSDSPLTQLPTVDFNFEDLRRRMADFTVRFDAFIEKGRKRVLEERNEFRGRLGEIAESQHSTGVQIQTLKSSITTHNAQLSREEVEKSEIQSQIASLSTHLSNTQSHRDKLRTQIASTQRAIDAKLAAQREYAERMDSQSRLNGPELGFWESYLGCRIEGAPECQEEQEGTIGIVFLFPPAKNSDGPSAKGGVVNGTANGAAPLSTISGGPSDKEREASFSLLVPDSTHGRYKVLSTKPALEADKVRRVEERLNETREIATLLKGMRRLFQEALGRA